MFVIVVVNTGQWPVMSCCAVHSGNYPLPTASYSSDLRCLVAELFRRNPRYVIGLQFCF